MNILNATLSSALRMATPFLFAGLGGLMAQQVGVYNFALEGQMLCGAFFGFLVAYLTKSLLLGALAAIISGLLMGWLLAFICIRFGVSQMVVGLGMNTLLSGVTAFCSRLVNQSLGQGSSIMMEKLLPNVTLNTNLTSIPVIGPLIFDQNIMTYTAVILFLAYAWWVKRTPQGLALRAVGEHPHASQTAGINVFRYRYLTMTLSGGIAALGGAFMTLSQVYRFAEDMTGGRGWIAIAAIALGRWDAVGTFFACLFFGLASSISNQLQVFNTGIPSQFAMMVPYIMTILTLLTLRGSSHGPAALAKPFMKNR